MGFVGLDIRKNWAYLFLGLEVAVVVVFVVFFYNPVRWSCVRSVNATQIWYNDGFDVILVRGELSPYQMFYPEDLCFSWVRGESYGTYNYSWMGKFNITYIKGCIAKEFCLDNGGSNIDRVLISKGVLPI